MAELYSIDPATGTTDGGEWVRISGSGLGAVDPNYAYVGGVAMTNVTVVDDLITGQTAPHEPGAVDVVVYAPDMVTLPGAFTYVMATSISAIVPDSGSARGGDWLTISGTSFDDVVPNRTTIGGSPLADATISPDSSGMDQLTGTTPAHDPGTVDVTIYTSDGTPYTLSGAFTYQ
jgi:hypothetical protein